MTLLADSPELELTGGVRVAVPHVTAVLVGRDRGRRLARTLAAVAAQTRPADVLVAVDLVLAHDRGAAPVESLSLMAAATPHVLRLPRTCSPGDAVHAVLMALACERLDPAEDPRPESLRPEAPRPEAPGEVAGGVCALGSAEWLWLLHDDAAPDPEALSHLLAAVETAPSVAIAGCKQVAWDDDQCLIEVGFSTSRLGTRVSGVERHEVDQGQHDGRCDVLAVSSAGMLIRRDVWDHLDGPDPGLAQARDDLDLCRRARLAGHRVVVVPSALIAHAAGAGSGECLGRRHWHRDDRRAALYLRLATVPWPLLPFALAWSLAVAPARAAGRLVLKQADRALDELVACAGILLAPAPWLRARRRQRSARCVPRRTLNRLYAGPRQLWRQRREEFSAWFLPGVGANAELSSDQPDRPGRRPVGARRSILAAAPVITALAAAGLAAARDRLPGAGAAFGPYLLPAPERIGDLWRAATSSWRPLGLGATATPDPFTGALALLAGLLGGSPPRAVDALLLGALPLAGLSAWLAAGALTRSRLVRGWAALSWAAAAPLLAAVGSGRAGSVLAHVTLPLALLALGRAVTGTRSALAPACAAGLGFSVVLAGAPSLALGLLAMAGAVLVLAHGRRARLLPVLALPAVLLAPWWWAVVRAPRLLLADPGLPGRPSPLPDGRWHLLGLPVDPVTLLGTSTVAAWLGPVARAGWAPVLLAVVCATFGAVPLAALAIGGLWRRSRVWSVSLVGWVMALAGLGLALAADRVVVGASAAGTIRGWSGPAESLLVGGLLISGLSAADVARRWFRKHATPGVRATCWAGVAIAVLAPVGLLADWTWHGPSSVRRGPADVLPAVAAAEAAGPAGTRTLVLRLDRGTLRWSLARAAGPRLGDDSAVLAQARLGVRAGPSDAALVEPVIASLLSDSGRDMRSRLADLAVGSVVLLPPGEDSTALALDASPGLTRVSTGREGILWRVELGARQGSSRPARVRVLSATGQLLHTLPSQGIGVDTALDAGAPGRVLVLAERRDPAWRASLGGRPLTPITHAGWAQAFALPATSGRLVVDLDGSFVDRLGPARAAVAALGALVAIPLPRLRRRLVTPPRSQPSRPITRVLTPTAVLPSAPPPRVYELEVAGLEVAGLEVAGLEVAGLEVVGLEVDERREVLR